MNLPVKEISDRHAGKTDSAAGAVFSTASILKQAGIGSSRTNAEQLVCFVLGCRTVDIFTRDIRIGAGQLARLDSLIRRRIKNEPLQYIIGSVDFYGNRIFTAPGVFIPRPETEALVEVVAGRIIGGGPPHEAGPLRILDIGTGSGNIAISLIKELICCRIVASDVSERALSLARHNAICNSVYDRVEFVMSDIFEAIKGAFDIIVSNPPYIARERLAGLPSEVKREPLEALDGGPGGCYFYSQIIEAAPRFLKKRGLIAFEADEMVLEKVIMLLESSGCFADVGIARDLSGTERVITAERR